jgi:hypothetical protein
MSHHQNTGQNHDIKTANRSFENVSQFKYLGTTIRNQNVIVEEIKRRLILGNACLLPCSSEHLSFRLLSRNLNSRIYKTIILPLVLYGHDTWSDINTEGVWEHDAGENIWTEDR